MKKLSTAILTFGILLFGCSAPIGPTISEPTSNSPSELSGSSQSQFAVTGQDTPIFIDMSGKALKMEDIKSIRLNYALGWNFDNEGYVTIRKEDVVGNCTVAGVSSDYYMQDHREAPPTLVCDQNEYWVECQDEIAGVLQVSDESVTFFPYENPGNNFLFLCDRKENELYFSKKSYIPGENGDIKVQPIGIVLWLDQGTVNSIPSLGDPPDDTPRNYDAGIKFISISFSAISHGDGDKVFGTRVTGEIQNMDSVTIHKQL